MIIVMECSPEGFTLRTPEQAATMVVWSLGEGDRQRSSWPLSDDDRLFFPAGVLALLDQVAEAAGVTEILSEWKTVTVICGRPLQKSDIRAIRRAVKKNGDKLKISA